MQSELIIIIIIIIIIVVIGRITKTKKKKKRKKKKRAFAEIFRDLSSYHGKRSFLISIIRNIFTSPYIKIIFLSSTLYNFLLITKTMLELRVKKFHSSSDL